MKVRSRSTSSATAQRSAAAAALLCAASFAVATPSPAQQADRWEVSSNPRLEIGATEGDPAYLFHAVGSGLLLPDGEIVVADAGYLDLPIFDSDGTLLHRMGGPGEFRSIEGMWLTPEGTIGIWDPSNRRFSYFDLQGNLESPSPVTAITEGNRAASGRDRCARDTPAPGRPAGR